MKHAASPCPVKKIRVYNYISYVLHVFDLPSEVTEAQQFENQFQSVLTQFSSVLPIGAIFYNYCRVIQGFLHKFSAAIFIFELAQLQFKNKRPE